MEVSILARFFSITDAYPPKGVTKFSLIKVRLV